MRLLEDARGGMERLLLRGLVRAERHVDHDQRMLRAAHDRASLQDHHIERHRDGSFQPVHDHAEGIADENEIAMAIEEPRRMRVVGGQTHDRLATLVRADVGCRQPLDLVLCRHVEILEGGLPNTGDSRIVKPMVVPTTQPLHN